MESGFHADYPHPPNIAKAMAAAADFLTKTLEDVQRVDITNVVPVASGETAWEAEANVWQPNKEIKSMGLHTFRPVVDSTHYVIRLDARLNVLEYEMHEPVHT